MMKKNKKHLKKIYDEEYLKALDEEEKKALKELEKKTREKARLDAKQKCNISKKDKAIKTMKSTGKILKRIGSKGIELSKKVNKNMDKTEKRIHRLSEMNDDLVGR